MVVFVPPGEVHWRGVTDDSYLVHIAIIQPSETGIVKKTIIK